MEVYVIHYTPLKERRIHIEKLFEDINFEPDFITKYDRENLEEFENKYKFNKSMWDHQLLDIKEILLKNSHLKRNDNFEEEIKNKLLFNIQKIFNPRWMKARILKPAEISLSLKHFFVLNKIKSSKNPALVVEDDVIANESTYELINKAFELCQADFDYVDLGGGCNLPFYKKDQVISNFKEFISLSIPRSRTTAAYIVSPYGANSLIKGLLPLVMPIDWQFQYLFLKNNFKVAWSNPPAFIHGSQEFFESSIN